MKNEINIDGELVENNVHEHGTIVVKPTKEPEGFLGKLFEFLGFFDQHIFSAEVEEVADWKENDEIQITVENLSKGGK